jgi:hypothetical protein
VWRRDGGASHDVLRIGRMAVERWADRRGGLRRVAAVPLAVEPATKFAQLGEAIRSLLAGGAGPQVHAVLESAWVPVMLVETGTAVWRPADVEALLRHRMGLLYDEPADPVAAWDVRVDHRAGERHALGYGFSPRLREALAEAASAAGCEWSSLMPAWAWGWRRVRPDRGWTKGQGHWAWHEQDRLLIGSFDAGRPVALNAAAPACHRADDLMQAVTAHRVRTGQSGTEAHVAATAWTCDGPPPPSTKQVAWHVLAAADASAKVAA